MAGLYIHIPFCRHKCAYCDFFSSAGNFQYMERYINSIITEWDLRRSEIDKDPIKTLYIGGGTPSLLPLSLLAELLSHINQTVCLSSLSEVTLEANPEDISSENITDWKNIGINRISVGIQSFNPTSLSAIDRRHSPQASRKALSLLSDCGINYSADLIYCLPGQTLIGWEMELMELLSYRPPHFSSYLLSYEPGTRLFALKGKGLVMEASDTIAEKMFEILCHRADEAGYNHYEISNLAYPGMEAKHNSSYWNYTPYIGLGTAAHSFDGKLRRFNPSGIKKYIESLDSAQLYYQTEDETIENRFNDYLITSLRTVAGFSIPLAQSVFGDEIVTKFMHNLRKSVGIGEIDCIFGHNDECTGYRIPRHKWLTSDAILRELILD